MNDYSHEATELRLWADNDGPTYRTRTGPALDNLARKMQRDDYSAAKASQFLADVLKDAAKSYAREFCSNPNEWKTLFPRWVRLEAADAMLASLWAEVELGNMPAGAA